MTSAGNRNTILIGDCVNILPQIDAGSIDFILTDPPYVRRYKPRDGRTVPNDDNFAWLKPAFAEMFRVLRSDSFCVSFYGWPNAGKFVTAFLDAGFRIAGHFVFPKPYTSPVRAMSATSTNARICSRKAALPRAPNPSAMLSRGRPTPATNCTRRRSRSAS